MPMHHHHTQQQQGPLSPRLVIETSADVDVLDDGYTWRKYGQKKVKGSEFPRSYYKCTVEYCPVKKQVEQRGNTIVNTYEGSHIHVAPSMDTNNNTPNSVCFRNCITIMIISVVVLIEQPISFQINN